MASFVASHTCAEEACIGYKQPAYIFPSFLYADTWQPIAAKCSERINVRRKDVE